MTTEHYESVLLEFVAAEFLPGMDGPLTETTPLIESGILDSLRIAVLLNFIRDRLGVHVPLERIDVHNFADIRTIAGMLAAAAVVEAGDGGHR